MMNDEEILMSKFMNQKWILYCLTGANKNLPVLFKDCSGSNLKLKLIGSTELAGIFVLPDINLVMFEGIRISYMYSKFKGHKLSSMKLNRRPLIINYMFHKFLRILMLRFKLFSFLIFLVLIYGGMTFTQQTDSTNKAGLF
jgi:hypothetical protein